jgi:hypothetical protein
MKSRSVFFGLRAFLANMFTGLIDGWTQAWTAASLTLIRLVDFWLPTFLLLPASDFFSWADDSSLISIVAYSMSTI